MPARLKAESTALVVVDVQEKLVPAIAEADVVVQQIGQLIDGAKVLQIPILVTEQYRKGLGRTVPQLAKRLDHAVCNVEKLKFSACIEPIRSALSDLGARTVLVCGIEAHVCVLQSCLDLLEAGYVVAVAVDAVGSRRRLDRDMAIQRLEQAGVVPTTVESGLLEMIHAAGTEPFKAILPLIR